MYPELMSRDWPFFFIRFVNNTMPLYLNNDSILYYFSKNRIIYKYLISVRVNKKC